MVRQADLLSPWGRPSLLGVEPLLGPVTKKVQIVARKPGHGRLRIWILRVAAGSLIARTGLCAGAPKPPPTGPLAVVDHQSYLGKFAQVIAGCPTVGLQNCCQCRCRGRATDS